MPSGNPTHWIQLDSSGVSSTTKHCSTAQLKKEWLLGRMNSPLV
jgi:hypothetical protein